jgi:uncharacterized membrane protein YedE/YeeE
MWIVYVLIFVVVGIISYFWVRGIDNTKKNHSDYNGDDLFGKFNEDDKDNIL